MGRSARPRMVYQSMGTTMRNPGCEWVRARLPLWVGVSDDPTERDGREDELSVGDRQSIERHLRVCPGCRAHENSLVQALAALASAADLPVLPDAPSIWPVLEARIAAGARDRSTRRSGTFRAVAVTGLRAWADPGGKQWLRLAWMQDSLRDALGRGEL